MMWEEKIDLIKKDFSAKEFQVPFTNGSDILKKIEDKFVIKRDAIYSHTNWAQNIKRISLIQAVEKGNLPGILSILNENQTYWFVAVIGNAQTSKQYVYSCSSKATQSLASITQNDFFIVDKKFTWFTCFHPAQNEIKIFKSGEARTPFDETNQNK